MPQQPGANIDVVITFCVIGALLITALCCLWLWFRGKLYVYDDEPVATEVLSVAQPARLNWLERIFQRLVHRYFVLSSQEEEESEEGDFARSNNPAKSPAMMIIEPQNSSNVSLLEARVEVLAMMVHYGKIGQTEGIKLVFGETPGSTHHRYQLIRALLKEELAQLDKPQFRDITKEQQEQIAQLGLAK